MAKRYSPELREKVLKEVEEVGSQIIVARRYKIRPSVISYWVKQATGDASKYRENNGEINRILEENKRLKSLIGDQALEIAILQDLVKKTNQRKQNG
jgi:transposase-like protein